MGKGKQRMQNEADAPVPSVENVVAISDDEDDVIIQNPASSRPSTSFSKPLKQQASNQTVQQDSELIEGVRSAFKERRAVYVSPSYVLKIVHGIYHCVA
jgi:hypothetical protein